MNKILTILQVRPQFISSGVMFNSISRAIFLFFLTSVSKARAILGDQQHATRYSWGTD